jgi:hypothetical protein
VAISSSTSATTPSTSDYIIEDFVGHFCEDYIPFNGNTQSEFGVVAWMWKSDLLMS